MLWQQAMTYLKQVPPNSADHALAQQKIAEYQRNLTYAESNVTTRTAAQPDQTNYWTLGSDRELVLATQGSPDQIRQVSSSCYETLHYNNSIVELRNGYVTSYDNFDNNLRVLEVGETAFSTRDDERHWTLGPHETKSFNSRARRIALTSFSLSGLQPSTTAIVLCCLIRTGLLAT
jgi:hypothetical protein